MNAKLTIRYFLVCIFGVCFAWFCFFTSMLEKQTNNFVTCEKANTTIRKRNPSRFFRPFFMYGNKADHTRRQQEIPAWH